MEKICDFDKCTGCSACMNVCPAEAISMKEAGTLGDIHPHINQEKCINCGQCQKVCPTNHPVKLNKPLTAYAVISKDKDDLMTSASGGASSILAQKTIENGGVVYGCVQKSYKDIQHRRIEKKEDLYLLKGSKYVQSDINYTYKQVKKDLDSGKFVLFSGTPCQNGALKNFLKTEYPNLILVDLCCHGCPSQKLLREDCQKLLKYTDLDNDDVIVTFRKKTPYKEERDGIFEILWGSFLSYGFFLGGKKGQKVHVRKSKDRFLVDNYITAFMDGLIFRESCYSCPYARAERCSDITIADYWGLGDSKVPRENGVSLAMPNSQKGKDFLLSAISKCYYEERPVKEAIDGNGQLQHPSIRPTYRDRFLRCFSANKEKAFHKYLCNYRHKTRAKILNKAYDNFFSKHKRLSILNQHLIIFDMVFHKLVYEYSKLGKK